MIRRKPHAKLFKLLQGYLAGYLAILTGHRPVVLANLQRDKVREAETDGQKRAMIWVDQHKTNRAYGNAVLALLPREVAWLEGLMEVSVHFGGEDCPYVFQFNGRQLFKLNMELRAAWHHAGMPGQISFGLIRTAIANQVREPSSIKCGPVAGLHRSVMPFTFCLPLQVKKHLSVEERKLVCEGMCHDVATADRFYTAVPEIQDVFRVRNLRMKAMEQDSLEPGNQSSASEDTDTDSQSPTSDSAPET
ncbi:uncharacterized protein LOC118805160 isoform X1 [Colossoma macropomum]|uniref:uncharacterized protein LOC118805160 isoform X1 n=1 Tax=Colossoma macropomum TaxID=42526 RepID=UPI001863F31E|nr:uncharacterized protein LOC118805160 isoform X1 [Colossoma macropomum]